MLILALHIHRVTARVSIRGYFLSEVVPASRGRNPASFQTFRARISTQPTLASPLLKIHRRADLWKRERNQRMTFYFSLERTRSETAA